MGIFNDTAPTGKFSRIGDRCGGEVVHIGEHHRTEFKRDGSVGLPMYWVNRQPTAGVAVDPQTNEPNRPVMDAVVTVDTGEADEYGNTERRVFVKGKAELTSLKSACTAAGVRDIEVGGRLTKTWSSGAGGTADPRVYTFEYVPPGQPTPVADGLAAVNAQKAASQRAATERLTAPKPAAGRTAQTKAALGIKDSDEPPF